MSKLHELKTSSPTPRAKERGTTLETGGTVVPPTRGVDFSGSPSGRPVPPTGGGTFLGTPSGTQKRGPESLAQGERESSPPDPSSTPGRRFFSGADLDSVPCALELEVRVLKKADLESFFREILAQHLEPAPAMIFAHEDIAALQRPQLSKKHHRYY